MTRAAVVVVVALALAPSAFARPDAVQDPHAASILSIEPAVAARGGLVTITGRGFAGPNVAVTVGGRAATVVSATGSTATFRVPSLAGPGLTTVRATNPGGHTGSIDLDVRFDGTAAVMTDVGGASAVIGPAGGTVAAGDLELSIPPGALGAPTRIAITPIRALTGSPFDDSLIAGARFEPDGLSFLVPATLRMRLPAGVAAGDVLAFGGAGDGTDIHLTPRDVRGTNIEILMSHFSVGGASSGGSKAARLAATYRPTAAQQQAEQEIAFAVANTPQPGTVIATALDVWFSSIRQRLIDDFGRDLQVLRGDFAEWQAWRANIQLYATEFDVLTGQSVADAMAGDERIATKQATVDAAAAADALLKRCTGFVDMTQPVRDVVDLQAVVDTLSLRIEEVALPKATTPIPGDLPRACAHVDIDRFDHASTFAVGKRNTVSMHAVARFWNGPDRTDVPIAVELAETTGGPPIRIASDTITGGDWQTTVRPSSPGPKHYIASANLALAAASNADLGQSISFDLDARDEVEVQARSAAGAFADAIAPVRTGAVVDLRVRLAGDGAAGAALAYALSGVGALSASSGSTDSTGEARFTFSANVDGTATITATRDDDAAVDRLTLTVVDGTVVSISPSAVILHPGETQQFTAAVSNASSSAVGWGASGGTIDQNGLYTAGATPGTYAVAATSVADPSAAETATVVITPAGGGGAITQWTARAVTTAAVGVPSGPVNGDADEKPDTGSGGFSFDANLRAVTEGGSNVCGRATADADPGTFHADATIGDAGGSIHVNGTFASRFTLTPQQPCLGAYQISAQGLGTITVIFTLDRPMHYTWGIGGSGRTPSFGLSGPANLGNGSAQAGTLPAGDYTFQVTIAAGSGGSFDAATATPSAGSGQTTASFALTLVP